VITRIKNRVIREIENIQFKIFSNILKKYNVEFFYKDRMGILTKRQYDDNFNYMFKTHNSCDALPLMRSLNNKIKNSKICVDIGANIGITTIWMARNCEKVYSFEPEKNNIGRFNENLSVNNVNNVELIQKAVSEQEGEAELYLFDSHGHHSLSEKHVSETINRTIIETISLDVFCKQNDIFNIDFLKIDVEGHELSVLKGSKTLLKNKQISLIAFEHSPVLFSKQDKDNQEVIRYLMENDYTIYNLDGNIINIKDISKLGQEDLYAIPN